MKLHISRPAAADLEEIADWIAADNPRRAVTFVGALLDKCRSLTRNPRRFPEAARIGGQSVRKLVWRGYVILYQVAEDRIEVVRIVHGARDWAALLDANGPDPA